MPDWTIEPLTSADDLDGVLAVEHAAFTNPWTREMYEAELKNAGVSFIVLARDRSGQVIGFCSYWRIYDELHINNLAILPDWRSRGIGTALLRRVLSEGAASGAVRALLEVRRSNTQAQRLYERFGFAVAGLRRHYYSQPTEDAVVLWCALPHGAGSPATSSA
jgi:[ribosomal protein S18]-alanine N-acetyltransferase